MTRVNLVDPAELSDQHLMAEYREIPMVLASRRRTIASKRGLDQDRIPARFTLGTGHVTFFYDKLPWLRRRYDSLIPELLFRGYAVDPAARNVVWEGLVLARPWEPDALEIMTSRIRIEQRVALKPEWYRWTRRPVPQFVVDLILG